MNEFSTILEQKKSLLSPLGFSDKKLDLHAAFLDFLWQKNQRELNIVSRKMTKEELVENHWMDALLALPYWSTKYAKVADLGSGGGFPAIVLAIEFSDQHFTLFEKSPKKQSYLKSLVKDLGLKNISITGAITEPLEVDLVMARAFKPLGELLKFTKKHYKNQGAYFLYKGRRETIFKEEAEAKKQFSKLEIECIKLDTSFLAKIDERNIVRIYFKT